mmetsp:Transcript_16952/g.22818  ORF Transcript_16952/g.22818 Transcript_16952/m.22818 type:complete len:116 (-) Transcript_16952:302-649(-)
MYRSADDLIERHWRVECSGFAYSCPRCEVPLEPGHSCVAKLLSDKSKLDQEISAAEAEIRMLQGAEDQPQTPRRMDNSDDDGLTREVAALFKPFKPEVLDFAISVMQGAVDDLKK